MTVIDLDQGTTSTLKAIIMSVVRGCLSCWKGIRSHGPSYLSVDLSREKHCSRAEQQNPTGQGPTSSCASNVVAGRITRGRCCSPNQNLAKILVLSGCILGESKTRKKPQTQNLSELEAVRMSVLYPQDDTLRSVVLEHGFQCWLKGRLPPTQAERRFLGSWPAAGHACPGWRANARLVKGVLQDTHQSNIFLFNADILPHGKVRWYGLVRPRVWGCL